jgi:hypothetical protein
MDGVVRNTREAIAHNLINALVYVRFHTMRKYAVRQEIYVMVLGKMI